MKKVLLPFLCLLLGSMVASASVMPAQDAGISSADFTSPATLTPGANNTIVISVDWLNSNTSNELLNQFKVTFPAGFVVQTTGNSNTGNSTTTPPMTPSGTTMTVGYSGAAGTLPTTGYINATPFTITINVFVPAGFSGPLTATYTAKGNGGDGSTSSGGPTNLFGNIGGTAPLPVQLVAFSGYHSAQGVALSWATASEQNSAMFEVQHSINGTDFETVGSIKAMGFSTQKREYAFIHTEPKRNANFYRLAQTDIDGKVFYSNILMVRCFTQNLEVKQVRSQPNLSANIIAKNSGSATLTLTDVQGRVKYTENLMLNIGDNAVEVPQYLGAGIYFLGVNTQNTVVTQKMIVQ